jgi:hypothetical protein
MKEAATKEEFADIHGLVVSRIISFTLLKKLSTKANH